VFLLISSYLVVKATVGIAEAVNPFDVKLVCDSIAEAEGQANSPRVVAFILTSDQVFVETAGLMGNLPLFGLIQPSTHSRAPVLAAMFEIAVTNILGLSAAQ